VKYPFKKRTGTLALFWSETKETQWIHTWSNSWLIWCWCLVTIIIHLFRSNLSIYIQFCLQNPLKTLHDPNTLSMPKHACTRNKEQEICTDSFCQSISAFREHTGLLATFSLGAVGVNFVCFLIYLFIP